MADKFFLFLNSSSVPEEAQTSDTTTLGGLTMGGTIAMGTNKITGVGAASADGDALVFGQSSANLAGLAIDTADITMNNQKITGLGAPTGTGDAVTKDYVDSLVISGGTVKEPLFSEVQMDATDGINALEVLYFSQKPVATDTIIVKNGTLTRTYTFVATEVEETDVQIKATASLTMDNFIARFNADTGNTQWSAAGSTDHTDITAQLIMIYEKASASGNSASRIYGVWATGANCKVVEFASGTTTLTIRAYWYKTVANMPAADPGYGRFGLRREVSALVDGEIHLALNTDNQWAWNGDSATWFQLSGPGSIPLATSASGGGLIGRVSFDSDKGVVVVAGVAAAKLEADSGVKFGAGGGLAVKLTTSNPGLTVGANGVDVKTDGSHGVVTGASGVELELVSSDRLTVGASGLDVLGVPSLFKINGTAVSANVSAANLTELTGGGVSDLHSHAGAGEYDYSVAEALLKGDPAYLTATGDEVGKARGDTVAKSFPIGIARVAIPSGSGAIALEGVVPAILTGATPGDRYFLGATGGLSTTAPSTHGHTIFQMGFASSATAFMIQKQLIGKK